MKQILKLNAFDMNNISGLPDGTKLLAENRAKYFGSASMLFYDVPLEIVKGEGAWLYDVEGTRYLDLYNNVPSVGHCHPHVVKAVSEQLAKLNTHTRYLHPAINQYAERLIGTFPEALSNVVFTCTGSESNDLALQMARSFTNGMGIVVTRSAYHGNTSAVSEVSPASFKNHKLAPYVKLVDAPDSYRDLTAESGRKFATSVGMAIDDLERNGIRFAALLVDTIFSSDGIYADPPGFMTEAIKIVHDRGGLFIADEVQPGFGRTGSSMWGFQRHSLTPDIVTLGKPMGNGYPMGGVVTRPDILDRLCQNLGYFNSFGGSPVAAAAGLAVLDVIETEGLMSRALEVGAYLRYCLSQLALEFPLIGDVRGAGQFTAMELVVDSLTREPNSALASAVINDLRKRQILIGAAGPYGNTLKIRPPLCFTKNDADFFIATLTDVLCSNEVEC